MARGGELDKRYELEAWRLRMLEAQQAIARNEAALHALTQEIYRSREIVARIRQEAEDRTKKGIDRMKAKHWDYRVAGTDGDGHTWTHTGACSATDAPSAKGLATQFAFAALTAGRAIYGQPGVGGCKGPYNITDLTVTERVE